MMETKTIVKVEKAEDKKAENKTAEKAAPEKSAKEVKPAVKETKPAAKKTAKPAAKAEKAAVKETKPAAKKTAKTAKTTAKSDTKTTSDKKVNTFIQFGGMEINMEEVVERIKADAAANTGRKTFQSLDIYVKPEDKVAYYVVNGKPGSVQL